ncbi:hypothetical protein [uncultured Helicobacter sp.]|uniref:hypothetical protein n=1 Tax=uncultured Helicobacter sp. TaxID=175537 RepID=UPI0027DC67BB|nr:hypothetical protein [uncultured Helicobacter sp.]
MKEIRELKASTKAMLTLASKPSICAEMRRLRGKAQNLKSFLLCIFHRRQRHKKHFAPGLN